MANSTTKQVHVSPGIYFNESELSVANKSLGITHLGVVGETLKGPAFEPIDITSWSQFQSFFGGTSTEKFVGSQYPKYELPYIAQSYLSQSQNLKVCRVLGLSGTNAGPAWFITAYSKAENAKYSSSKPMVVAVLRSKAEHSKAKLVNDNMLGACSATYEYDGLEYAIKEIEIKPSSSISLGKEGCDYTFNSETGTLDINPLNLGTFTLVAHTEAWVSEDNGGHYPGNDIQYSYAVSLNPSDTNYITNVIGTDPILGDSMIYVEELYDVALEQLVANGTLDTIGTENQVLAKIPQAYIAPKYKKVESFLVKDESALKRSDVGKRFLAQDDSFNVHLRTSEGMCDAKSVPGKIYTVRPVTDESGKRHYYYTFNDATTDNPDDELWPYETTSGMGGGSGYDSSGNFTVYESVYMKDGGAYYVRDPFTGCNVVPVNLDVNNYKESYRYASTPWIVSEMKGSAEHVELTKLFRFHTISDGNASSTEVKVSIMNIYPDSGTFDVVVRSFFDTDANPIVLEKYKGCDLVPGSSNYIALKIGSFDGAYETKSKYITVEVNENEKTEISVPAGFLGYPVRNYKGFYIAEADDKQRNFIDTGICEVQKPHLTYNVSLDEDVRVNKQYFGLSDISMIDADVLSYKGVEAYNEEPDGLTPCFHLDSRIVAKGETIGGVEQEVSVDGVTGYEWQTVSKDNVSELGEEPRFGSEAVMASTIYEDVRTRKFTLCFYGGFDGWDYYRTSRSNSDDFKANKYRGYISEDGQTGANFSYIEDKQNYGFDSSDKVINSDYYAYLSAIRKFANPKETDINVFATPGIDYVNNPSLVNDALDMVESERADCIYVITTPDKPFGASDSKFDMFSADEAVDNLADSGVDSNWACTYYPWVKYFDAYSNQYIYLPPTRDVVKSMAYTDNTTAPWYAAAGWNRGITDGINPKKNLVLAEQDELYDGRINFINNFASEGMRLWGDKNLQIAESNAHMNRISKRRCLIRLRKLISIACIGLIFDPNDNTTVQSFRSAVEPILEDFVSKRALTDAKLVIDDSEESRDRLELNAQIYLKFMPNLEYINIGLVATPQGVSFDDI